MSFEVFIFYALTLGIPASIGFVLTLFATKRRRWGISLVVGVCTLVAVLSMLYLWPDPENVEVTIIKPADGDGTSLWVTVEGTVDPPDSRVWLLVHPSQDTKWWVQPPVEVLPQGVWRREINLGNHHEGAGEYFQVLAVASDNPAIIEILRNRNLHSGARLIQPPALPNTAIVTVWRHK